MQLHILDMVTGDKLYPYVDVEVTLLNAGVSTIFLKGKRELCQGNSACFEVAIKTVKCFEPLVANLGH